MKNVALVFAGGVGKRMGNNAIPKQFLKINSIPIIIHTIKRFENSEDIDEIYVVSVKTHLEEVKELIVQYNIKKVKKVVPGGSCGQESIYNGLFSIDEDDAVVLIHDGVRPIINSDLIKNNINSVLEYGSAISCVKEKETIVLSNNSYIDDITDKSISYIARAPQSFYLKDILAAHKKAINENKKDFVDSCSLMKYYGYKLHIVETDSSNIKVTTPEDYYILKALLNYQEDKEVIG